MSAIMWRAPASVIRKAGSFSFVQDNGIMRSANTASNSYYLFSEVGAGVQPLVLVGDINDILCFMMESKALGIDNQIESLPDIYMGARPYKPGPRFVGLFPFHNAVAAIVDKLAGFAPGSLLTDLVGGAKDIKDNLKPKGGAEYYSSKTKPTRASNLLAVTWSYLPDKGLKKIGSGRIDFTAMYGYVERVLMQMHGV